MRLLIALSLLCFSTFGHAQVLVVNLYQPLPGKAGLTASYMHEAQEIHSSLGLQTSFSSDLAGMYRYNMLFDNYEAFGKYVTTLNSSPAWQAFLAKTGASPSATQVDNLLLNQRRAGPAVSPGMVTQVTVWEAPPGNMPRMLEAAMGSVAHHERQGAAGVSVWSEGNTTMYYATHHESMEEWGKFRDTPNPGFNAYMQSQVNPETGQLDAEVARVSILTTQ